MKRIVGNLLTVLALSGLAAVASAQGNEDYSQVEIETHRVADNIYMLTGQGGNMGALTGPDGVILIDDQFAPLTGRIRAAIAEISDRPIRFLINTHYHGDHTGGNENFGKAGVIIVAHDNVRRRMSQENFMTAFNVRVPPAPEDALPVVTFSDSLTFHVNEEDVTVAYLGNGHTDGDSIIHFKNANVIHTGDLVFNGAYPVIDVDAEGSIEGMIDAQEQILSIADDNTVIIPGHGPLAERADVKAMQEVLMTARNRVRTMIDAGQTLEQIKAARPNADYDAEYGQGFVDPDRFIETIYTSLTK